jgi:hypothetical protein
MVDAVVSPLLDAFGQPKRVTPVDITLCRYHFLSGHHAAIKPSSASEARYDFADSQKPLTFVVINLSIRTLNQPCQQASSHSLSTISLELHRV